MATENSEEVKKTWPRKGDCIRFLFGTVQHEGVMLSCSPFKGTCKVEFTRGVDSVNLKRTKWGVILKEKGKGKGLIVSPDHVACASRITTLFVNVCAYVCE